MNKPIIGVITYRNLGENDRPYSDHIKMQSVYYNYIYEMGAIPIGISFPYGKFKKDALKLCDGFLFTGGQLIESYQLEVVHYAIKTKKPMLGVCNGLQTFGAYDYLRKKLNYKIDYKKIEEFNNSKKEINYMKKVDNHNKLNPFYLSKIDEVKHKVYLDKNSRIYNIYKKNIIDEPSLHEYALKNDIFDDKSLFKVTGIYNDDIEVIEYKKDDYFALGVQFHIELENQNKKLFKEFIDSCKKRN